MSVQFCVLGSGSAGNAALLMSGRAHVLIDAGFSPEEIATRLDGTGASWESLDALVLTHTHADHLKKKCLARCACHDIEFVCHERHVEKIGGTRAFKLLREKGLVRTYSGGEPFSIAGEFLFQPIPLPHDCAPTFGFKIEARAASRQDACATAHASSMSAPSDRLEACATDKAVKLGYLVDLGVFAEGLEREVADVDLLALEFNHDVEMERNSGRSAKLIQRVLGPDGHLSNAQAAEAFRRVLESGANGGPKYLVQMHLSRDCNRADLAYRAAQEVVLLTGAQTRVFSTRQERRGTVHTL